MILLVQCFPWVFMWIGVFMVAKEIEAKNRVINATCATIFLVISLLVTNPVVRLYDSWIMLAYGGGCFFYWYKLTLFG